MSSRRNAPLLETKESPPHLRVRSRSKFRLKQKRRFIGTSPPQCLLTKQFAADRSPRGYEALSTEQFVANRPPSGDESFLTEQSAADRPPCVDESHSTEKFELSPHGSESLIEERLSANRTPRGDEPQEEAEGFGNDHLDKIDPVDLEYFEQQILYDYPNIPAEDITMAALYALQPGRIGCKKRVPIEKRVALAVRSQIRHQRTDYDWLLDNGVCRNVCEARIAIFEKMLQVEEKWQGLRYYRSPSPHETVAQPRYVCPLPHASVAKQIETLLANLDRKWDSRV